MSVFGEDRERWLDEANESGGLVTGPDGHTAVRLGDRIRAYQESPDDVFDFWVRRAPEEQRDGKTISREAIEGVAREIGLFVMARAQLRVDQGWPPDMIEMVVGLRFAPEPDRPEDAGVDSQHRTTTLRSVE